MKPEHAPRCSPVACCVVAGNLPRVLPAGLTALIDAKAAKGPAKGKKKAPAKKAAPKKAAAKKPAAKKPAAKKKAAAE